MARLVTARDTCADAKEQLAALRGKARVGDVITPIEVDWEAMR